MPGIQNRYTRQVGYAEQRSIGVEEKKTLVGNGASRDSTDLKAGSRSWALESY